MKTIKKRINKTPKPISYDFFGRFWEKSWTYLKTVVDVLQQPVLILDKDLKIVAANQSFYNTFLVKLKDTQGKSIYKVGNGQWNIPALRNLLENILPDDTFFQGFQVAHEFPIIGRKVMILNGRQIHVTNQVDFEAFPSIIVLAIQDVTDMVMIAESLNNQAKDIEAKLMSRTQKMEMHIAGLEKKISKMKSKN